MLTDKTIGFLGCGNLAESLIKGLISSGAVSEGRIVASDRIGSRLIHIAETYEIKVFNKNYEVAGVADIIFITVKPADVPELLSEVAPVLSAGMGAEKLLISAAAGVTTSSILKGLRDGGLKGLVPVIRAMPNTPVIAKEGAIALSAGPGAGDKELKAAKKLFGAVGEVVVIEDEALMDAVTGLSGSGPAYVFLIIDALVDAGVAQGLKRDTAKTLAVQTVLGAARLAKESEKDLLGLREMVTSPGGTTIEGLKKLEEADIRQALINAVAAATKRSRELSGA
jgi:pyrroline-5-carboxylate reductase